MPSKRAALKAVVYRDPEFGLRTNVSPLYLTFFMIDWGEVFQSPSSTRCVSCSGVMMAVEPVKDRKGVVFEGLVCHNCKTVLWSRKTPPRSKN